jgi:hypothetical protein
MTLQEIEASFRRSANDLALLYALESDPNVNPSIEGLRGNLNSSFKPIFPDATADQIAAAVDYFIGWLLERKFQIELHAPKSARQQPARGRGFDCSDN